MVEEELSSYDQFETKFNYYLEKGFICRYNAKPEELKDSVKRYLKDIDLDNENIKIDFIDKIYLCLNNDNEIGLSTRRLKKQKH